MPNPYLRCTYPGCPAVFNPGVGWEIPSGKEDEAEALPEHEHRTAM